MIETLRPYLELIYFVTGGPLLAIFAFLALRQITVAKETSRIASQREAYRLASEQIRFYVDQVVPAINEFDKLVKGNNAEGILDAEIVIESEAIRVARAPSAIGADALAKFRTVLPAFAVVVNRLEAFSIFFTSGVAAEGVAYSSVGSTFERTVRRLLPLIIVQASGKNYENTLKLFLLWHNRLEKERLEEESSNIQNKLASLQDKKITPVGLEK